jgi:hypothetical protein
MCETFSLDFFTMPTAGLRVLFVLVATQAMAHERLHTRLSGYEEVPSVSTTARGEFRAKVSSDESPSRGR